jgi:hypothetical protein
MKIKRHFTGICTWLVVSALMSGFVPLRAQAASQEPANTPPYVIRGHVYVYDTTTGLAGARVRLQFETCDEAVPASRTVTLPPTDASGAWEFDERDYEQAGGLGCPCPGTSFTIHQQNLPAGYIAVRTQTPNRSTDAQEMLQSCHPPNTPHTTAEGFAIRIGHLSLFIGSLSILPGGA